MLLTLSKGKLTLSLTFILLTLGACKQSEFYDKSQLLDPTIGTANGPGTGTGTGSEPGNTDPDGGTTNPPPVVVTPPPVVVPPITLPPVVVTPIPVNCTGQWSECSKTCGGGNRTFSVFIQAENGGLECSAVNGSTQACNTQACPVVENPVPTPAPVNCSGSWGACNKTCGGGVQTFQILTNAANGGLSCTASNGQQQSCNTQACPINVVDRSEIFTQETKKDGDVDILWVIDDSGSMADEQDNLARNFSSFINQFIAKNVDFKMAITTTDGTSTRNGKMVGDSSKLTSAAAKGNQAAFTNNFTKWVKVGTSGSGIEQGLKTASSFLDRYSSSFLREDAYLAIVFLSDEEDQSEKKVAEYIARYQAAKKNKGMVKAYSIVTEKTRSGYEWETIGQRYLDVSKATSGTHADLHSSFADTLKDMGGSIVNLLDKFALAETPYDNQVTVLVNNTPVTSGWTYDSVGHTLKFNAGSVPAEGSKIEVRYKVKATVLGAI